MNRTFAGILLVGIVVSTTYLATHYRWSYIDDNRNQELGIIVQEYAPKGQFIYVWGYMPQLYFFSERRAPTPYFDSFSLVFADRIPLDPMDKERLKKDFANNPPAVFLLHPLYANNQEVASFLGGYVKHPDHSWLYFHPTK